MQKFLAALVVAAIAMGPAGCARTAAVKNLDNIPVTTSSGKPMSAAQVRTAIIAAGTSLGWKFADAGAGKLEGTISLRTHTAVVEIPYSPQTYSIVYKRSENLTEANGQIHNNYNGWVQNLDRAIRTEMARS
jgi:hypothetical protein